MVKLFACRLDRLADNLDFWFMIAHADGQFRRTDAALCEASEHLFGDAVFQRVKGNDCNTSARFEMPDRCGKCLLQNAKLIVDLNPNSLKNLLGRMTLFL